VAAELTAEHLPQGSSLRDLGEHRLKDLGRPEHVYQLVHPDLVATFPPLVTLRPPTADLPARVTELIGREDELRRITDHILDPSVRLVTLTGPGGTGKTTLAIRVAEDLTPRFADGSAFVDASSARDRGALLVAIARAIRLDVVGERPLEDELVDQLHGRKLLIVLDNLEQVSDAAGMVARLLRDCPDLAVLATSREALHVRAEQVFPVPPLSLPEAGPGLVTAERAGRCEAVRLFVDRAQAARPDFRLTDDNAPAVAEICRRLDGLPLAIELAAARLRLFTPEVLRDRLGDRLALLRSGMRDLPERQQTLRATMDWSYELLEPGEQRLFEFLAAFADAEVGAIEAVAISFDAEADGISDVLDGLEGLADKSLVRFLDLPGSERRVTMLETIREFAADRLDQHPDASARVRRAHAMYFADRAGRSRADLTGSGREAALVALAADAANLRIAWAFWVAAGDLEQLDKLADPLMILDDARGWYLDTVGMTTDMLAVLAASPPSKDRVGKEIALRTSLARALMTTRGVTREVEDAFTSALDLFEQGADVRQQFPVLRGLASLYMFRGQLEEAAQLGQEILTLGEAERERDPRMLIEGNLLVGAYLMSFTDLQGGLDRLDAAIALIPGVPVRARAARVGNDSRVACYTTAGFTLFLMGYPDRAAERMQAALALAVELQHPFTSAYARFHAGLLHLWRGDAEVAHDLASQLLEVAEEHGFRIWTAAGTCLRGATLVGMGRPAQGLADIARGMDLYRELRSPPIFWPFLLFVLASASHLGVRPADAVQPLETAIEIMSPGEGSSMLPELHLLKGDVLAALAATDADARAVAEPWYQRALDRAGVLGARTAGLRAATRLARLRLDAGDPEAAASVLAPVYATFTEGFATANLVEAREVLDAARAGSNPA